MNHYRISMTQEDGREIYGRGPTLTEALTNLMNAANEYDLSPEDRTNLMDGLDEIELAVARARRKALARRLEGQPNPLGTKPGA